MIFANVILKLWGMVTIGEGFGEGRGLMEANKVLEELKKLSEEDFMTGLLNRRGGISRISQYMKEHPDTRCAFIIFDGDYFKKINDSFGHQYGDRVIIGCSQEIKRRFSDKGIIFRLGGDEFVVFYKNVDINEVSAKLNEFMAACNKANMIGSREMSFTFSVGVAMYPDCGTTFDDLMSCADEALYKAKYEGRNCYQIYTDGMVVPHREQFMFDVEEFSRGLPGGFFVYEATGSERLLYVGDSLVEMFKCKSKDEFRELVGNSFRGIVHPDDLERAEKEIHDQQFELPENTNNMDYVRYRIICKDGSIKTVDDFGHLVHDHNYGMVYYVFLLDLEEHVFKGRL